MNKIKIVLSVIVTMITVIVQAAAGGSVKLENWYEALLDDEATTCMRWDDFWMGANVAIPVTGLDSPIPASDVVVTAGTYSEFGIPYVLTEGEMWNRYGAPVLKEKNLGNVEIDWYDNVWQNWDAEEDGAYGYELSADVWPNWSQVSGRQWILIPTGVPRLGTHTFSVKINGVKHDNYVVSFVMAEDQEPVPYNVTLSVAGGHELRGKVSGGGVFYIAGKKASLKATANKGYVFAGWEGPLDDTVDPRNPSISYVVEPADVEFVAKFISLADDVAAISFTMPKEYENGVAIDNVAIDVSGCTSLPKVSVKGLPTGLKFTAKPIYKKGSKTEIEVPANTIYGTPTKSGVYTVAATVTTAGKKTATYSQTVIVRKRGEKVVVAECDATGGKVKGAGVYAAGKKVTLKATANKGFVFAGWYEDASFATPCDSSFVDYRTASYAYTMGNEDKTFYARFIPAVEDSLLDLTVNGKTVPTTFTISEYAQLKFDVDSLSLPKISVKGLPAGMKFTAKPIYKKGSKTEIEVPANTIYGAPTKPGNAEIQVSLSNQSIKKAIVKKFIIEVPNFTAANSYFVDNLDNGVGKKRVLSVGISNIEEFLPSLELVSPTAKLAVKGLPSGLKYNAKTGEITGIATKVGTYTVTLTVTDGKAKYVSTITIEVEPLPDWVVGTFNGYIDGSESYAGDWVDWVTITINSSGKVSYKDITEDGSIYVVNPKDIIFKQDKSGDYIIETDQKGVDWYNKQELRLGFVIIDGVTVGVIEGESKGADIEDGGAWVQPAIGEFYAIQNVWKNAQVTKLAPTFIKNTITYVSMSRMRDDDWDPYYGGYLTLKYGANGAVTTAYSETEGGKATATGSAQLVPYEVDGNITKAWLYAALKPKGRDAFGVLLFLSIDTSNGNVYGDNVMVEDYLLEVDE